MCRHSQSSHGSTVSRMSKFHNVCWAGRGRQSSTKAKAEAATDKLRHVVGRSLNGRPDQDNGTSDENADSSPITISKQAAEGKCSNLAKIVNDEDDTSSGACALESKSPLIRFHGVNGAHERRVYTSMRNAWLERNQDGEYYSPKPFMVETRYPMDMMK